MIEYKWDKNTHTATCIITVGTANYIGTATCHPDDSDFESEKTGQVIACSRAKIKMLQNYYTYTLKPKYDSLMEYYYTMKHSKNFNPKSYESKMLYKRLCFIKKELDIVKENIAYEKQDLKEYIDKKDEFYKKLRNNRKKTL